MFGWVLKTPLKPSIKASVSSTFLVLAAIWLNTFFPFTLQTLISSNIQKRSSSFVAEDFYFYLNEYLRKNIHKYANFLLSLRQNNGVR